MSAGLHPATFNVGADVVDRIARTADGRALIWTNEAGGEAHANEYHTRMGRT